MGAIAPPRLRKQVSNEGVLHHIHGPAFATQKQDGDDDHRCPAKRCFVSTDGFVERTMATLLTESDGINFGELPPDIDALLQDGVASYRRDPIEADRIFRQALAAAPAQLPVYFCLYKIHTYRGNLDDAEVIAEEGLREAASQAGWDRDWRNWPAQAVPPDSPGRFALYTLKALAFIHLKKNNLQQAQARLAALKRLDPSGAVGWPVVAALAEALE